MSDRLIGGGEVLTAVEASAQRALEVGYDAAVAELGFDPEQARRACGNLALGMMRNVPAASTVRDVYDANAAAHLVGLIGGIRLGRLYSGSTPEHEVDEGDRRARAATLIGEVRQMIDKLEAAEGSLEPPPHPRNVLNWLKSLIPDLRRLGGIE